MAKPGPKSQSAKVIELRGNPGKRPVGPDVPAPKGKPSRPSFLAGAARTEWDRLAPLLSGAGLMGPLDRGALAAYCDAYGRWVEATKEERKTGALVKSKPSANGKGGGTVSENPWRWRANKALEQMRRWGAELGLSPSSRRGLGVVGAPRDPAPQGGWDGFD